MHTSVFKIPSGRRFGSIAIYAHAHQYVQNTVRQTVWKHCCLNTCTPACSKYRQADVLETSLYKQMHTSMFKIPSGRRFGDLALIFGLSLRAQNAVRQVFYVKKSSAPRRALMAARPAESCVHSLPEPQNLSRSFLFGHIPVHLPARFRDWLSPGHTRRVY